MVFGIGDATAESTDGAAGDGAAAVVCGVLVAIVGVQRRDTCLSFSFILGH